MTSIVGANLRRIREAKGISQTRLGGRADVNPATVNQIEMGGRNPSVATLERLAEVLQVPMADLFWEEVDSPKECAPSQSPLSDKPPEERREYPYPWMADALARIIERWRLIGAGYGSNPEDSKAIARLALYAIQDAWSPEFMPRTLERWERAEREQVANLLLDLAEDARARYEASEASKEAAAAELPNLDVYREMLRPTQEPATPEQAEEA